MTCLSLTSWQQSERQPALIAHPLAASLDEAHAAIELWEYYSRKRLDTAQRLAVELMMAETEDGRWAADTTGRAESRQNGKGDEIEVVELWGLLQRSEAILHTAHEAATAASAHGRLIGLVEGHQDLRSRVKKKQSWNGNYSLLLNNDGLIVWRTRTGAGGRGLDDISRIVIDEAQHAQPEELASSLPILSVNPNPQKNFIGSGGVSGKSAFWWRQRRRALTGSAGRFSWLEHSAEVVAIDADGRILTSVGDVADPQTWRRANPAYPSRISHDFLLDQLETLGPALFAREHLCVWDPEPGAAGAGIFDLDRWLSLADPAAERGQPVWGVDVDPDRRARVGVAWSRPDGAVQVMLSPDHLDVPAHELAGVCKALTDRWGGKAWLGGAAAGLAADFEREHVPHELLKAGQFPAACGMLLDRLEAGTVRHGNQPQLNSSVQGAVRRSRGTSGEWEFDLTRSTNVGPVAAVTRALFGLTCQPAADPGVYVI